MESSAKSSSEKIFCAYSGKRGAYAQQAIDKYFSYKSKPKVESLALDSFSEVFAAVSEQKVQYAMIPIENSLNGSVYQNYDNFIRHADVVIVGSVSLSIHHSLLVCKGTKLEDIKTVYSHPQGFGQSRNFLETHKDWTLIDSVSTATAAELVSSSGDKSKAAIGSALNAEIYNLDILAQDIQDEKTNYTRFVLITKKGSAFDKIENANTATFIFTTKNESGALYKVLGVFDKYKLNMTRLESRPIKGQLWKSWFYADIEMKNICQEEDSFIQLLMSELKENAESVRLLGVYLEGNLTDL